MAQRARERSEEHLDTGGKRWGSGAGVTDASNSFASFGGSVAAQARRARRRDRLAIRHSPIVGIHVVSGVIEFTVQARSPSANEELGRRRRQVDYGERW